MSGLSSDLDSKKTLKASWKNTVNTNTNTNTNTNLGVIGSSSTASNLWTTTAYPIASDCFDNYDKHIRKTIGLELIDGSTVILKLWTDSVENICEHTLKKLHFTWKWPFIKHTIQKYVSFDYCSKTYNVNCTLTALTEFLELKYTSYAELMLKDTIKHG